jgi:hypothetical protein
VELAELVDELVEDPPEPEPVLLSAPISASPPPEAHKDEYNTDVVAVEVPLDDSVTPRKKKPPWKERILTRGESKRTRSGRAYSTISTEKFLFSAQGNINLRKAMEQYGETARKALIEEIDNMLKRKVWSGVLKDGLSKRQRKSIIRSHTFLKAKLSPSNVFQRLKARLVAMGNLQDKSLYREEDTTSPTVMQSSTYIPVLPIKYLGVQVNQVLGFKLSKYLVQLGY